MVRTTGVERKGYLMVEVGVRSFLNTHRQLCSLEALEACALSARCFSRRQPFYENLSQKHNCIRLESSTVN